MPNTIPAIPPSSESTSDSIKNCIKMSCRLAPSALRIPISRVRSVTDTSMMFMMPMPPTSSYTLAIPPSSIVKTPLVALAIAMISAWLRTMKSSS